MRQVIYGSFLRDEYGNRLYEGGRVTTWHPHFLAILARDGGANDEP